jgi:hypothetical protein
MLNYQHMLGGCQAFGPSTAVPSLREYCQTLSRSVDFLRERHTKRQYTQLLARGRRIYSRSRRGRSPSHDRCASYRWAADFSLLGRRGDLPPLLRH